MEVNQRMESKVKNSACRKRPDMRVPSAEGDRWGELGVLLTPEQREQAVDALLAKLGNPHVPHTLYRDDPEPPVGSVVLDGDGHAWQRINGVDGDGWASARDTTWYPFHWDTLVGWFGCDALTLIHEGDGE